MPSAVLIELHYLPSLEYFCVLSEYSRVYLEAHEHFVKQSYRNRCYINTTQGLKILTVPLKGKHSKIPISEIEIDHSQRWANNHWRTLESAYRNSPFFEHYADDFKKILYSGTPTIFDLNFKMLSFCLDALKWPKELQPTTTYEDLVTSLVFDARSMIVSQNSYEERSFYRPVPYYQVFGSSFEENLSILDLIFCTGPDAGKFLQTCLPNR